MGVFDKFVSDGLRSAMRTLGEQATIGADTFTASFDEMEMSVDRNVYGDSDEITTTATCMQDDLSAKPAIGGTLLRVATGKTYVILGVQADTESYEISLRIKNG
jgi:hypothetical protein